MCHLKVEKVVEEKGTVSVPRRSFLLSLLKFVEKDIFCHAPTIGANAAPMTGTSDEHIGSERCIDMSLAVSGGQQLYR